jgi:hypothetical protein
LTHSSKAPGFNHNHCAYEVENLVSKLAFLEFNLRRYTGGRARRPSPTRRYGRQQQRMKTPTLGFSLSLKKKPKTKKLFNTPADIIK